MFSTLLFWLMYAVFILAKTFAMCYNKIMKIKLDGLLFRGERVAVALSGGEDSVALFTALCALESSLGIEVLAINVEHGIRGEESLRDSEFVKNLCDNVGKRLLFYKVNVPEYASAHKMGLEAAARELRYACFFRAIDEGLCDRVATAHHAGDNAESVLLNVFRGSGTRGLCGIKESAYGGRIIRPMLGVKKEEIKEFIQKNSLKYVTDATNFDDGYTRNFIRNNVLPLVKEKFPDVEASLYRMGCIAAEDDELLAELAKKHVALDGSVARIRLDGEEIKRRPILSRAVLEGMQAVGLKKDYERVHIEAVMALISAGVGGSVSLPHGFIAYKGYDEILIYKDAKGEEFCLPFKVGEYRLPQGVLRVEDVALSIKKEEKAPFFAKEKAKGVLYLTKNLPDDLCFRTRKEGDIIKKFGGGSKPLKELLINKKIDKILRDSLPVLASRDKVLCVAGVEVSADAAVGEDEASAYKIIYER